MRLFAAIFPPPDVVQKLAEVSQAVKALHTSAITVKPEKMHVTLRFFGDADLEKTVNIVNEAVSKYGESFDLTFDHIDAFPLRKTARVIFAGAQDPRPVLRLMKAVETDRPHAHLTLARLPKPRTVKLAKFEPITFRADRIVLVNSTLGEGGKYETLQEWKLA
jgi:2'-5' RNA ligase